MHVFQRAAISRALDYEAGRNKLQFSYNDGGIQKQIHIFSSNASRSPAHCMSTPTALHLWCPWYCNQAVIYKLIHGNLQKTPKNENTQQSGYCLWKEGHRGSDAIANMRAGEGSTFVILL